MAIEYIEANNERHSTAGVDISAPFAISAWVYLNTISSAGVILALSEAAVGNRRRQFFVTAGGGLAFFEDTVSIGVGQVVSTNTVPAGVWAHALMASIDGSNRKVWLEGVESVDTASEAGSIPADTVSMGAVITSSSWTGQFDGKIAYVTVWEGREFTQDDANELYAGKNSLLLSPDLITHYWPMTGDGPANTRIRDIVGPWTMETVNGTPSKVDSIKLRNRRPL